MANQHWYPAFGHPDGSSGSAHYRLSNGHIYPAHGHPEGSSGSAWFRVG